MTTYRSETLGRAMTLIEGLRPPPAGNGPMTIEEIADYLGEDLPVTRRYLRIARQRIAPQWNMTIPRPVADDGYLYRLTGDWTLPDDPAIRAGVKVSTTDARTRVESIVRDLTAAKANTHGSTSEGRKIRQYLPVMEGALASLELIDAQLVNHH